MSIVAPSPSPDGSDPFDSEPGFSQQRPDVAFDRVPPQDLDAEQSVLGSMLLSREAIDGVVDNIRLKGHDFYRPVHEVIFDVVLALRAKNEPADPITVAAALTKDGDLARVGGASYLHTLVQAVPTAANAEYYADIVRQKAILRRGMAAGTLIVQMCQGGEGEVDEIVAAMAAEVAGVVEGTDADSDFTLPQDRIDAVVADIEQTQTRKGLTGVSTGFIDLDELTSGLQPGQLIIVAGRPGMGKSTFAMDIARAAAIRDGVRTAFLSLEMPSHELDKRVISAEGQIGLHRLRTGGMQDDDWDRLAVATQKYRSAPMHVNDTASSLAEIQSKLRRLKRQHPDLGLGIIDYMQLVRILGKHRPQIREQEVAEISRSFKLLAKELQIPLVVLAQLNRGPEMRSDKKPTISDLRESGSQEQDADIVILLNRLDAYEKESPRAGEVDVLVAKHRNGPTAEITVAAQLHYSRFVDMAQT